MAKKIRFPLQMNGADVRTIEELRENFDLESVLGYFTNGKLITWLKDRYYDNEAVAIEALSVDNTDLNQKLMSILGISADTETEEIDLETIQRRNEKLMLLRQITDDKEIIDNVDCVAFNQEDLNQLLKEGKKEIYLCQGEFIISICEGDVSYTGIGNPTVSITFDDGSNINFGNIRLNNVKCTSNSSDMLLQLGMFYKNGNEEVEQDYVKAIEYFEKSAELGNAEANYELGECYYYGKGIGKDYKKAVEWYRKAAEQGNVKAQYDLGWCYSNGRGIEQSWEKASGWYHKAAEQGYVNAQYCLGWCYRYGKGVEQNYEKSAEWYHNAAEQGDAESQYELGDCFYCGRGVEENIEKAVEWYRKAAEQGHIKSQHNLGCCYEDGKGVEQNYEKAVEWYRKAAEQGDSGSQNNLGICYDRGKGVKQNYEKAREWYSKAAEQGMITAQTNLKYVGSSNFCRFGSSMY